MIMLLLGLDEPPEPHDAADALAVAICHVHGDAQSKVVVQARRVGPARRSRGAP